jgi:hypothetical protein
MRACRLFDMVIVLSTGSALRPRIWSGKARIFEVFRPTCWNRFNLIVRLQVLFTPILKTSFKFARP